jgi:hypothetical protein
MYDKTMSAHGSHLAWRSWSPDTILKVYYPRTIHAMLALNWLTGLKNGTEVRLTEPFPCFVLNTYALYILRECINIVFILQKRSHYEHRMHQFSEIQKNGF